MRRSSPTSDSLVLLLAWVLGGCASDPQRIEDPEAPAPEQTAPGAPPSGSGGSLTPGGQFLLSYSGVVRDTSGAPLPGARVTAYPGPYWPQPGATNGVSATTDQNGAYRIPDIPPSYTVFTKDEYESRGPLGQFLSSTDQLDAWLQPVIFLDVGKTLDETLYPMDNIFRLGADPFDAPYCGSPCKRIRIQVPTAGKLVVSASPQDPAPELQLIIQQGEYAPVTEVQGVGAISAEAQVSAGEVQVYLGLPAIGGYVQMLAAPILFVLDTELQP